MTTTILTDRYHDRLHGVLNCYDRIVITGTIPGACYAGGMTAFLMFSTFESSTMPASQSLSANGSAPEL